MGKTERSVIVSLVERHKTLHERTLALNERYKRVLHMINASRLLMDTERPEDEILQQLVNLLPLACHYPGSTGAKIDANGKAFTTVNYKQTPWKQSADIIVSGEKTGTMEIYYLEEIPKLDKKTLLKDDRELIDALAGDLGVYLKRKQGERKYHQHRENK